jgi:hypothetical protein
VREKVDALGYSTFSRSAAATACLRDQGDEEDVMEETAAGSGQFLVFFVLVVLGVVYLGTRESEKRRRIELALGLMRAYRIERVAVGMGKTEIDTMTEDELARAVLRRWITREDVKKDPDVAAAVYTILSSYSPEYLLESPSGTLVVPASRMQEFIDGLRARAREQS